MPLLAYVIRKAEAAAIAMDSRAFGANKERAFLDEFHWTRSGLLFAAALLVFDLTLLLVAIQGDLLGSYAAF